MFSSSKRQLKYFPYTYTYTYISLTLTLQLSSKLKYYQCYVFSQYYPGFTS